MGFYHLLSQGSGGGFSAWARSTEKSPRVVPIGKVTYDFVRVRTPHNCLRL